MPSPLCVRRSRPLIPPDRFTPLLDMAGCIPQNHRTQEIASTVCVYQEMNS